METNANVDVITGDPKKAINKLAYPLMASMLLIMLNNIIDGIWVAGLGASALAALGFVTPLFTVLVGVGTGVGAGANSLIARFIGMKDKDSANNAVIHALILFIIVTVILTLFFLITLKDLLIVMGASNVIDLAVEYGFYIFLGSFSILLPPMFAGIFRAEGDVKKATVPMAVTAITNMILDPIFIYTFDMGIGGAAIATVIASVLGLLMMIYWMFIKKSTYFSFKLSNYKRKMSMYKDMLTVSIPASIEEIIMAVVAIIINLLIEIIAGTNAVAVFTAGWRVISIGIIPAIGVATAGLTVCGVAYGARNYDRLKEAIRYSAKLGFVISLIVCLILVIFSDQIAYLFAYSSNSSQLAPLIGEFLRVMFVFVLPISFGATAGFAFQGMGKGPTSLIITIIRELILVVFFASVFGLILDLGIDGIYWGMNIGGIVGSIIGYAYIEYYVKKLQKSVAK